MKFEDALKALREGKKIYPAECNAGRYYFFDKNNEKIVDENGHIATLYVDGCMKKKWEIYKEEMPLEEKYIILLDQIKMQFIASGEQHLLNLLKKIGEA